MTRSFDELLEVEPGLRDHSWEARFFDQLTSQNLRPIHPMPQAGPDGFSYLLVEHENGRDKGDPAPKILGWLATRGIGLVLNPHKSYPDYVFTYGMLWNFRERGEFLSTSNSNSTNAHAHTH